MNYNQNHMRLVLPVKYHELYNQKALKIYWKHLVGKYFCASKKNINYQNKFTLNLPYIYLVHINHFLTPEMKYVIRGNVRSGKCYSGNCPSGKCPFGELSFGELSVGKLSVEEMSSGNCPSAKSPSGKCPSGNCYIMEL